MLHKFINPIKLAVVALLVVSVSSAMAEWKQAVQSAGNNIGLTVALSYGGPLRSSPWPHQFPRGSGNTYTAGRWNWGLNIARDTNGDGVANDTAANLSRGGRFQGELCALEDYDLLAALYAAGEDMYDASQRISVNRIYASSDPEDVAEWPARFREGRTLAGAPIFHGAETIVASQGDCFSDDGRTMGASIEYQFYFLNFAESNNMAYMHVFIRQMSEYNKWNPNADFQAKIAGTAETGQIWQGMQLVYTTANGFRIGGRDEAWAYLFPRQIIVQADRDGVENSFTTPPAMMGMMPLRMPELNGQTLEFTNSLAHGWSTEYGLMEPEEVLEGGRPNGRAYRYGNGRYDATAPFYPGYTNPWTGGPVYGWPGVPLPDEPRYDQWWWGTANASNSYNFWGEFKDVAPRDSFSLDAVIAFVPPKNPPFTFPPSDLPNIDNPEVQDQLSAVEAYMDVAEIVSAGGFILPETPAPPPLTIIPGEKQVTITWSDVNVNTPDAYYSFLQDNPTLDPDGLYREYDFEGYRLYRSFVGPSDSHSELIWEGSISGGDLAFFYTDTRDSDNPLFRMNNGMRVWYALVPYDNNYDPGEQKYFSLPDPASGKLWNRLGAQLYTVQPRSDASNFRKAELASVGWAGTGEPLSVETVPLTGSGGLITETPKYLEPFTDISVDIVNNERLTTEQTAYLAVTGMGPHGGIAGSRTVALTDASGNFIDPMAQNIMVNGRGGSRLKSLGFSGGMGTDGISYSVGLSIKQRTVRTMQTQMDLGGYGGDVSFATYRWGEGSGGLVHNSGNSNAAYTRAGEFKITWGTSGGGITCTVQDLTHGKAIPFSPYIDDENWGFIVGGATYADITGDAGREWGGPDNVLVPQGERSILLAESVPADNTEDFYLYVNGQAWKFTNLSAMPASGTVMTVITAYGSWDGDTFNQIAEPIFPGDKWKIVLNPYSMNPEDADLSKIMVVPNPYMASSALDLSPSQRRLEFVNLPARCTIRIYSLGGHLVNVLNHIGANRFGWGNYKDWDRLSSTGEPREFTGWDNHGGTEAWNLQNRFGQTVASGLYFYHVTDERGETHTGKFYVIN